MTTPRAAARRTKIILCVDVQIENTMALQTVLEGEGYGFRSGSCGAECMNLVNQFTPALIFLDIQMPDRDGSDTAGASATYAPAAARRSPEAGHRLAKTR